MKFPIFTHLIISLYFFIYFTNSYRKINNLSTSFQKIFLNSLKSNPVDFGQNININYSFCEDGNVYPNFLTLFKTINNYVLPRYDEPSSSLPITLLAVSGGVDSMALLHTFHEIFTNADILSHIDCTDLKHRLKNMYNNTFVVHFNHKCRKESENDWDFVKKTCKELKFPFIGIEADSKHNNVAEDIEQDVSNGIKSQLQCRIWRNDNYSKIISSLFNKSNSLGAEIVYPEESIAFGRDNMLELPANKAISSINNVLSKSSDSLCDRDKIGYVFTGHTINDSVETIIFKLFRGVNIKNIRGIGEYNSLDANNDISMVRPFVSIYKKSLIEFMKAKNHLWREDSSNERLYYRRNIIRNLLIPILFKLAGDSSASDLSQKSIDEMFSQDSSFLPQCITNRMINLVNQSKYVDDMVEAECIKFENYIRTKNDSFGNSGNVNAPATDSRQEAYNHLMDCLAEKEFKNETSNIQMKVNRLSNHMKLFGIKMPYFFSIYEWSLIDHYLVKITILKRWIDANVPGVFMNFDTLNKLYNFIVYGCNKILTHFVINKNFAISRHRMFMRIIKINFQENIANNASDLVFEEGSKVYSDDFVNFYSHDFLDVKIDSPTVKTFGVDLTLSVSENYIQEFDIRMASPQDIILFHQSDGKTIYGVLSKMGVPHILKDSVPIIALRKSNKVIGIYGLKAISPHYPKFDIPINCNLLKTDSIIDTHTNVSKTYKINITN